MGKQKKLRISTICFGDENEPARILIEDYVKVHGKRSVSPLIRELIVAALGPGKHKQILDTVLKNRYKSARLKAGKEIKERSKLAEQLRKRGIDPEDL